MINNYITEIKPLKYIPKTENINHYFKEVFEQTVLGIAASFEFSFKGIIQRHDQNTGFFEVKKESDWLFCPSDRTFNCYYVETTKNLNLALSYQNKLQGIKLKNDHIYCLPYWMTHKFISEEDVTQYLVNVKFWSDTRPINKKTKVMW